MSTKPRGRASSRTVSSVMSVFTFDAFFGHETHSAASGASVARRLFSSRASSWRSVVKTWAMSVEGVAAETNRTDSGKGSRLAR